MGRYIRGNIDLDFALGTLAANTLIAQATQDQVGERTLVTSVIATYALSGFTVGDNIGPIEVGLAHSDYTAAEIEAFVERGSSWNEGDQIDREISSRKIRRIGVFQNDGASGDLSRAVLNDGKPIKTRLNWILNAGQGLDFWVYNTGGSAVGTTDPNCHVVGHANLFPK